MTLQLYDHGAAASAQGRLLRRPGYPRRPARRRTRSAFPHYVLDYEQRFRARDRPLRRQLLRRRDADPLRRLQPADQVRRSARTPRASSAPTALATGHYVGCARDAATGPTLVSRRRRRSRPELFPVRHDARAVALCCAFRSAACPSRRCARWPKPRRCRWPTSPTARTSASCRRATTATWSRRLAAGRRLPGEIVHLDGRVLGRHDGIVDFTIGQRRGLADRGGRSRCTWFGSMPPPGSVIVGPRAALHTRSIVLRNINWLGQGTQRHRATSVSICRSASVRRRSYGPRGCGCRAGETSARGWIDPGVRTLVDCWGRLWRVARTGLRVLRDRWAKCRVLGGGWIERTVSGVRQARPTSLPLVEDSLDRRPFTHRSARNRQSLGRA